jgi:hypothetical protein
MSHSSRFFAPGKSSEPVPDMKPERAFGRGRAARAEVMELFMWKISKITSREDRRVLP